MVVVNIGEEDAEEVFIIYSEAPHPSICLMNNVPGSITPSPPQHDCYTELVASTVTFFTEQPPTAAVPSKILPNQSNALCLPFRISVT
jgi:hypothetical protein